MRDFLRELGPLLENMPVARYELAVMPLDVRERTEAIQLGFEDEVGMIERLGKAQEPHGADGGHHHVELGLRPSTSRLHRSRTATRKLHLPWHELIARRGAERAYGFIVGPRASLTHRQRHCQKIDGYVGRLTHYVHTEISVLEVVADRSREYVGRTQQSF